MILNEGFIAPRAGQMNPKPGSTRPKGSNEHPKGGLLGVAANGKFQLQIYAKCAQKDKDTIIQAWEDSKQFSDALGLWKPKGDYQLAVSTYMGARSTSEDLRGSDFPKQIRSTYLNLQAQLYFGLFLTNVSHLQTLFLDFKDCMKESQLKEMHISGSTVMRIASGTKIANIPELRPSLRTSGKRISSTIGI